MITLGTILGWSKVTRLIRVVPVEIGPIPITKVGGAPFWPKGTPRPRCSAGHFLCFFAQIRLSDVPGMGTERGLVSYHYCVECAREGNMTFGARDPEYNPTGYDVTLIEHSDVCEADGLGLLGEPNRCQQVSLVPAPDGPECWELLTLAEAEGAGSDDLRSIRYEPERWQARGMPENHAGDKLGGWPFWVQRVEWEICPHGARYLFVGQVSESVSEEGPSASGGQTYLWVCPTTCQKRQAEMTAQFS